MAASAARTWVVSLVLVWLGGCATPPLQTAPTHIRQEPLPVAGTIPSPVQVPLILPKPKAIPKPETYSVVVNNVRVQELLFALARDAKLNVDIHPGISGVVTLNAIDQTLPQLLTRIAKQTDVRWELEGPNLVVMPDTPYLRLYRVDYLNMDRTSNSTVSVSGNVGSGGSGGGGGANSSSSTVQIRSDNNFWKTLVDNLKALLQETDKILPAGAAPPSPTPSPVAASSTPGSPTTPPATVAVQAPAGPTFREAASVIANPEAGVLSIRATSRQHEKVQEFLDQVLTNAKRQVFIEATIVEVTLSNQYQRGIDWSLLRRGPAGLSVSQGAVGSLSGTPTDSFFTASIIDPNSRLGDFSVTLQLLESFGNVRVLSSPKLSVLNNQSALLRVVNDVVYFKVDATTTAATTTGGPVTSVNTTANTVAVGFVMSVTPQIGEADTILLNLRPSLTRITSFVNDPNPALTTPNRIPQLQRREMESMIKINSGQVAVMGGLIQDELSDFSDSIPGVNRSESLANLFGQRNRANTKTELVVFLRPVVIKDASIDGDFRAYRSLIPDEDFMARPNPAKPPALQ